MGNMVELETGSLARQPANAAPAHLTPRQLEVLALLCEGLPNKLIGRQLNISSSTVKIHVAGILRELNVASRLQAVIAARRRGLIGEPAPVQAAQRAAFLAPKQSVVLRMVLDGVSSRLLASDGRLAEAAA
jgi:DNA-binding CsgD family transcriptional regulator